MKIDDNGIIRDMTPEEEAELEAALLLAPAQPIPT